MFYIAAGSLLATSVGAVSYYGGYRFVKMVNAEREKYTIDVVYSWIDGNNSSIQIELNKWKEIEQPEGEAGTRNRFNSMDELKYSLRSIHKYMPWVRNIYIITTMNVIPAWFDIARGEQSGVFFIDDSELLSVYPTFNSLAKEAVMHKIKGLSETYIYFNDDLFLGRNIYLDDFVYLYGPHRGKSKLFLNHFNFVPSDSGKKNNVYFMRGIDFTRQVLIKMNIVGKDKTLMFKKHTPDLHFVSEDEEKWRELPDLMMKTANSRFRSAEQIYDNSIFDNYWKYKRDKGYPGFINNVYVYLKGDVASEKRSFTHITKTKPVVFCINDGIIEDNEATRKSIKQFQEFLESYYPEKAPWELDDTDTDVNTGIIY